MKFEELEAFAKNVISLAEKKDIDGLKDLFLSK
jgi:hypothetical protein